jgi:hypothetical protein
LITSSDLTNNQPSIDEIAEALAIEEVEANRNQWSDRDPDEVYFTKILKEDEAAELHAQGATIGPDGRVIRPSTVIS